MLDYNWGPDFTPTDGSGIPTNFPPPMAKQVINMFVPAHADSDGNELGGIPWCCAMRHLDRISAGTLPQQASINHKTAAITPAVTFRFAVTKQARGLSGDPRPSLEERYTKP